MKKYKTTLIFSLMASLVFSQNKNITTVKTNYPDVFKSIEISADNQWNFNPKIKAEVIQGQADAFLNIVELHDLSNNVLVDAILKNSLPNTREQNLRVLKNSNGTNPFSRLQCDWYKVQLEYRKNNGSNTSNTNYNQNNNTPSFTKEYDQPQSTENNESYPISVEIDASNNIYSSSQNQEVSHPTKSGYENNNDIISEEFDPTPQEINPTYIEESNVPKSLNENTSLKQEIPKSKIESNDQKKEVPPAKPNYNSTVSTKTDYRPMQEVNSETSPKYTPTTTEDSSINQNTSKSLDTNSINQGQVSSLKKEASVILINEVPLNSTVNQNSNYIRKDAKKADNTVSEETTIWF